MDAVLVIAVAAALGLSALAVAALAMRRRRTRSDRTYDAVLQRLDEHMEPIADTLRQLAERADETRATVGDRELAPNLERLLEQIAAEGAPAHAFRQVAEEVAPELSDARALPRAKRPPTRDDLTGVRDRPGYEAELEREVARAHRTGRPLALVVLDLGDLADARVRNGHAEIDRLLQEFAALLVRVTRVTDTVCRRRGDEFGILLPDTTATGARHFHRRVQDEAGRATFGRIGQVTFSAGIVEWRPSEPGDALDARAHAAIGRSRVRSLEPPEDADGDTLDTPRS